MSRRRSAPSATPPLPAITPLASAGGGQLALWLTCIYLSLIFIGIVVFRLPGAMIRGNEMSFERAVFTVVNAATLTGFQQSVSMDEYGRSGIACVVTLTICGMLYAFIVGGIALVRVLRLGYDDRQVCIASFCTSLFFIACGTAMLAEPTRGIGSAMMQATSAFANSGLFLGRLPGISDWRTFAALLPLAFLGGLSIPVLMELTDAIFTRRPISKHTRIVLTLSAAVYLIGLATLSPWGLRSGDDSLDVSTAIATGSAMSIDSRTCGLPLAALSALSRPAQWILVGLMLIGAAPGGVGGGLKLTTPFHIFRAISRALRREPGERIGGIALVWAVVYLGLVLGTLLMLLAALPELPADRLVFLAASAVGTVGLSHDPVSSAGPALYVLSLAMLLGRLAPLVVLWWTVRTCNDTDVAVG